MTTPAESKSPRRLALVTVASGSGETGGVERLYRGLAEALEGFGLSVDTIAIPLRETGFDEIVRGYLAFYDLDLSAYDAVISTKAPSHVLRHRNHVCYLPHPIRTYYDMTGDLVSETVSASQVRIIQLLDYAAFTHPGLKGLYCVGQEVRQRLKKHLEVDSRVLHHPSTLALLPPRQGRYLLLPGRLHRWKRVDLAIRAAQRMEHPLPLVIAGDGEETESLAALAKDNPNVSFVGFQSEQQLAALYAEALAVVFCPLREDYGLVTVEAFGSAKPVVTCSDSGEPARMVSDGYNGLVCEPDADSVARAFDWLATHPDDARVMGENGQHSLQEIHWSGVCGELLSALGIASAGQDQGIALP